MIAMPQELTLMLTETDRLTTAIRLLRAKKRLTLTELKQLAGLKADLLQLCPADRYAWREGLPVIDILKTLQQIETEKEI